MDHSDEELLDSLKALSMAKEMEQMLIICKDEHLVSPFMPPRPSLPTHAWTLIQFCNVVECLNEKSCMPDAISIETPLLDSRRLCGFPCTTFTSRSVCPRTLLPHWLMRLCHCFDVILQPAGRNLLLPSIWLCIQYECWHMAFIHGQHCLWIGTSGGLL